MTETNIPSPETADKDIEMIFPGIRQTFDRIVSPTFNSTELLVNGTEIHSEFRVGAAVLLPPQDNLGEYWSLAEQNTNATNISENSLLHAEMSVMMKAFYVGGDKHFPPGTVLLTTVEPCGMCAGAAYNAGIENIVFSLS